jgi:tetratricopeptide (TPR) repeat protein
MPKARQAALKALAIDDSLAAAHTSLGYVKSLNDFDWPGAESEFKRALQLNSGDSDAHFGYGITYLAPQGRLEEAVREMQMARDLDPLSAITNAYLGLAYHFTNRLADSAAQARKALELDPDFVEARMDLANLEMDQKNFKGFYSELALARALAPESRTDLMNALACAIQGKKSEALDLVHKPAGGVLVRSTSIASVYAALGDREHMYNWLERAYADRDGMLAFVNLLGVYRPYRSEPRFVALEKKLGFN